MFKYYLVVRHFLSGTQAPWLVFFGTTVNDHFFIKQEPCKALVRNGFLLLLIVTKINRQGLETQSSSLFCQ